MITKLLNEVNENIKTLNNLVQDKEYFEKLDERIEKVNNYVQEQKQEIERLNNIINELEKWLRSEIKRIEELQNPAKSKVKPYGEEYNNYTLIIGAYDNVLDKLQELKGSNDNG